MPIRIHTFAQCMLDMPLTYTENVIQNSQVKKDAYFELNL